MSVILTTQQAEEDVALWKGAYLSALQGMTFITQTSTDDIVKKAREVADNSLEVAKATVDSIRHAAIEEEDTE